MNNFLLYLGGLLIAALAVLFAVPHFIDWNSYRGVFEAEASRILGRELRVGGAVNVRFLPVPYVSFEKIRIADQGGENGSIIRIDSFTMWLSVPPLLRGVLEAHQVELRRPVLQLATDASGSGNWSTLSMNPGSMPFVPKDVALQSVRILDGAIVVNGPARNELARLADITGELAAEALDGPYKFKGSLKWDSELRQVRFATAKQDPSGDVRFKAAVDAPATGNSYVLDGRVRDLKGAPKLDGDLTAKLALAPGASVPPEQSAVPEVAPAGTHPASTPTPIKGDVLAPPVIEGAPPGPGDKAASPNPSSAPAAPTKPTKPEFDFRAKVTGDTAGVELSDLAATIDTGTGVPQLIAGSAKLSWNDKTRLDVRLASKWLDLDRLMSGAGGDIPLEAARGLFETVAAALPDEADTNATLDFDQLTLGGEPISNVHFAASRSGGPLEIKGVRASLPGGTRLQLDGVLTPGGAVPRIDGTVFVSGQSLLRFLGWGFRKPDIGDSRTDGPFALDGRFLLAENRIELTNATAEISDTPLAGAVKLSLGQRKQLSVSLEGTKVDATQIRSGVLGLGTVKSLFLGGTPSAGKDDTAGGIDLALKLKLAELADGDRILRDVDAEMSIERGTLSMPRLRFSTPEGLAIDAEGSAKDVVDRPDGSIRALVSAPNEAAAKTFIRLLDLDANDEASLGRLSRLAPMRVAATLTLHSGETNTSHLALDGSLGGGRITAALQLQGGRDGWRKAPADITATITSPSVEKLVSALFDVGTPAAASTSPQQPGQLLLKAAGTPTSGLLTIAEVSSDTFSLDYSGRVSLPAPDQSAASGTVRVSSADARGAFALAGLKLGEGAAGVPLAATLSLDLKDKALTLETNAMTLGASTVGGKVTLTPAETGGRTVAASLAADSASFSSLLSTVLARESAEPTPEPPPAETSPRRDAKATAQAPLAVDSAPADIWPEQAFDLSALDQLNGKVSARIGALTLEPGLTISDATLEASFGPQGISVGKLEGTAIGGKLSSKLDIERARAGVGLNGSLRIDIASTPAATAAAGPGAPGDVASMAVDFSGRALSPAALVSSLTGKGSISAGDATLTGMSPTSIAGVVEAALSGKGPSSGDALLQAVNAAAKQGEVKLGKVEIPVVVGDGALKLDKVTIEAPDGRSTFSSVIDLASMKLDSEWQIEPRLNRPSAATQQRPYLPAVTVVYTGKLSALSSLEPTVSTSALERELSVRKMERDVDQLEFLRKQDQARARQERERRKALEAAPPAPAPAAPPTAWGGANTTAPLPPGDATMEPEPPAPGANAGPPPGQVPDANGTQPLDPNAAPANGSATASAAPDGAGANSRPVRKRKPANDEWRPFQTSPF